jgi:hypothetical protein
MKARFARLSGMVTVLGLLASPALAQMVGNPVYFSPKAGVGLTIAGDYGRGLNDNSGKMNYFGGRATLGLPMFAITLGGGSAKPSGGTSTTSFGADAAVTVIKGPMVPVSVSLQAGVGSYKVLGTRVYNVPVGAALAFNVKSPGASVEPWVAPRLNIVHSTGSTQSKFGASGGVNVGLPSGLGFHVALDYVAISGAAPLTAGAGLHYAIKIPSLGPVGK